MATANPEDAPMADAAADPVDPRSSLKRAAVYVTDAQVSGIIDRQVVEKKKKKTQYSFVVFVVWSDSRTTTVWRSYNTIFTFQVDLLGKFPEEAGERDDKDGKRRRIIPYLPGKKLFTRSDAKLASQREPQIADWVQKLIHLPERVSQSEFVVNLFKAREGDPSFEPEEVQASVATYTEAEPPLGVQYTAGNEGVQVGTTVAEVFANEGRVETPDPPSESCASTGPGTQSGAEDAGREDSGGQNSTRELAAEVTSNTDTAAAAPADDDTCVAGEQTQGQEEEEEGTGEDQSSAAAANIANDDSSAVGAEEATTEKESDAAIAEDRPV